MLKHSLAEGIRNAVRSFWLSATAITVLTVSLGTMVIVLSVTLTSNYLIRNLDSLVTISALIKQDISEERIAEVKKEIEKIPEAKEVIYVNREESVKRLQNSDGTSKEFQKSLIGDTKSLTWRLIEIKPKTSEDYAKIVQTITTEKYSEIWNEVLQVQNFIDVLTRFYNLLNVVSIFLISIFLTLSVLVMVNILRITIYSHKEEIEIMRLVGATNNYIRGPFVAEGAYYNIIASVIVAAIFIPSANLVLPNIQTAIGINTNDGGPLFIQIYGMLLVAIIINLCIGIVTSYYATQKYLNL